MSASAGAKRLLYRFDVPLTIEKPLYAKTRQAGPFAIVTGTLDKGAKEHVTGTLDLSWDGSSWKAGVSIDQNLTNFGLPLDQFGEPALVSGDPATQAKLAVLSGQKDAAAVTAAKSALDKELAAVKARGKTALDAERRKDSAELLGLMADHLTAMEKQQKKNAAELQALIAKGATAKGKLLAEQNTAIAELKTRLDTEKASLVKQVQAAELTIQLQAKLRQDLKTVAANWSEELKSFDSVRATHAAFVAHLPKKWSGIVNCKESDGLGSDEWHKAIDLTLTSIYSNGAKLYVSFVNRGFSHYNGNLTILNESLSFPVTLHVVIPYFSESHNYIPGNFDLQIAHGGKMTGIAPYVSSTNKKMTCSFDMSS